MLLVGTICSGCSSSATTTRALAHALLSQLHHAGFAVQRQHVGSAVDEVLGQHPASAPEFQYAPAGDLAGQLQDRRAVVAGVGATVFGKRRVRVRECAVDALFRHSPESNPAASMRGAVEPAKYDLVVFDAIGQGL